MSTTATGRRSHRPPRPLAPSAARLTRARSRARSLRALAFLAPALLVLLVFVLVPALEALRLSFTDASGFGTPRFVGLENYLRVLESPASRRAILNTLAYALLYGPAVIVAGLASALLLNRKDIPFRAFFRTIIFLPFVISMAVASIAWNFLLDPDLGLVAHWLGGIGLHPGDVFASAWALPVVTAIAVWKNFGYFMVIFLAGLQGIPAHLYEAATLDGAGPWRKLLAVTIPGLRSTMTFVIIFALVGAFQAFDQIYILTQGGPDHATETIVYRIYTDGFRDFEMGYASAFSYVLLAITLVLGLVQLRINALQEKDLV